jgi:hypothetical protein
MPGKRYRRKIQPVKWREIAPHFSAEIERIRARYALSDQEIKELWEIAHLEAREECQGYYFMDKNGFHPEVWPGDHYFGTDDLLRDAEGFGIFEETLFARANGVCAILNVRFIEIFERLARAIKSRK